jgi:glycosyltransferase involved in cell wall biosynthesis
MQETDFADPGYAHPSRSLMARLDLKIFHIMPRAMYFGAAQATSIDLCVRDLIRASRFATSTQVVAEAVPDGFEGLTLHPFPPAAMSSTRSRANYAARLIGQGAPDVVIVQQHLPTASAIARRCLEARVVLQTHNFQKADYAAGSLTDRLRRRYKRARYRRLAGLIHVSEACARAFAVNWPDVELPQTVVNNGLDFGEWTPAATRADEVLFAGRCVPEKGGLEAAEAAARVLALRPGWTARFILSAVEGNSAYLQAVRAVLAPLGPRARIDIQRPFAEVKAAFERAAIAVVPSIVSESFGRTALEAHAGGAALISSGTGGLPEVSGSAAIYLPEVTAAAIASALNRLIDAPQQRAQLARDAAAWVRQRFSIETQADRLDSFCVDVAAERSHLYQR